MSDFKLAPNEKLNIKEILKDLDKYENGDYPTKLIAQKGQYYRLYTGAFELE